MIVDYILGQRVKNVVFLAGDVHYVQANAYDPNGDGTTDFHEFMAGPLSAGPGQQTSARVGLRPTTLVNEGGYMNFGLIRVTESSFDVAVFDEARRHAVFPSCVCQVVVTVPGKDPLEIGMDGQLRYAILMWRVRRGARCYCRSFPWWAP